MEGVAGKAAIYSGIAIDIPQGGNWGAEAWSSDPEEVCRAVRRVLDAGASGIVVCREYEEMREPSLRAIGRAIRDVYKTTKRPAHEHAGGFLFAPNVAGIHEYLMDRVGFEPT